MIFTNKKEMRVSMKEEKNAIKVSLGVVISIIIILILLLIGGFLLHKNHTKIAELENIITKQEIENERITAKDLETENTVTNNTVKANEIVENKTKETAKFVIPSLFTSNAKKTDTSVNYTLNISDDSKSFLINIENGVPTITTGLNAKSVFEGYGLDISKTKINGTKQKINGFTKKVVDACIISDEHQFMGIIFVFLMEDGTVEYSKLQNMLDKVSTQGAIKELKDMIRLQKVELLNSGWADSSAIAIDKDNNYYDVSQYIN